MRNFTIPRWVKTHLALNKSYQEVSDAQKTFVREGLKQYVSDEDVLATVVIPAWNEEDSILSTLSSLAVQKISFKCELLVVNNNSTDSTQQVLDDLGVHSIFESKQGIGYARQAGLENAHGKYFLCADADCIYPPTWVEKMVMTMHKNQDKQAVGVYSDYSFITTGDTPRWIMALYESARNILYFIKLRNKVHLLVRGFSFGIVRQKGLENGAFLMGKQRKGKGIYGTEEFAVGGEDGNMAFLLIKDGGKVLPARGNAACVWTSDRRLIYDGGFLKALKIRFGKYFLGKKINSK